MTLFQYIIRILMGNSDTVFAALVMGIFGYMGWLLWKINGRLNDFGDEWKKHQDNLSILKTKMDKIDEGVYKELMHKLDQNIKEVDKLLLVVNDNNNEIERMRSEVIAELKESTNEVKDIIMIILNNRARSIKNNEVKEDKELLKKAEKEVIDDVEKREENR